jgi:DDE superfamily endonuclease
MDRITVLVCANMAGTHRIKLKVIDKNKNPRCFKNISYLPVHYCLQSNAWMTSEIFTNWFKNIFVPDLISNLKKNLSPEDSKILLLLDNCRAHPSAESLNFKNFVVRFLPPNVTRLIQPMDQGIINSFKAYYKKNFLRQCLTKDSNIMQYQRSYNLKDAAFMVSMAWNEVKITTLISGWKKIIPDLYFSGGATTELPDISELIVQFQNF